MTHACLARWRVLVNQADMWTCVCLCMCVPVLQLLLCSACDRSRCAEVLELFSAACGGASEQQQQGGNSDAAIQSF